MKHAVLALLLATLTAAAADKPNIILILADDLGWSDTTLYGHTHLYKTPNLERLAKRGMTFTHAYSASPLCSPTRACIMTGQTPARTGITTPSCHEPTVRMKPELAKRTPPGDKAVQLVSASRLDTALPTLGKLIKANGYATGHFGKWHLGAEPYSPLQHGFDVDIPHTSGPGPAGSFVAPWKFPNFKENKPGEHIEDRVASEAVKWMRSVRGGGPFYMNYWMFSVHAPFDAKKELIDLYRPLIDLKSPQRSPTFAAMVHSMDDAIGTLLDEIDREGIADQTAIIFYADNGGNIYNGITEVDASGNEYVATPTSNVPLRGGKATVFEGGIRVPCVVVWPGVTKPESRSDTIIQSTDLYPTILNRLGISIPPNHKVDGHDITPALRGENWDRGPIFTYFPHAPGVPDWLPPAVAVHSGNWKLIRLFHQGENGAHDYLLYNLKDDLGETTNLARQNPEKVVEMDRLIEEHLRDSGAMIPVPNRSFDPSQYRPEEIGVQKGGLKVAKAGQKEPDAPAGVAKGQPKIGSWEAKDKTIGLAAQNGELTVHSAGNDPWIKTSDVPNQNGPFTLEMEIYALQPGAVKVYAGWDGKGFVPGQYVTVKVNARNSWVPVTARIPDGGKLIALRINVPGRQGITRLRNIRLKDANNAVVSHWKF